MAQAWLAQERRGATIRWARAAGDRLDVSAYEAVVDDRTLIVPTTHVCFRNGHATDIVGVTRLAHAHGAYVLLDDYQRTGRVRLTCTRWGSIYGDRLPGVPGRGGRRRVLYVRRNLIERLEPAITGWFGRSTRSLPDDALDWSPTATRFESGNRRCRTRTLRSARSACRWRRLEAIGRQVASLVERYRSAADARGFVVRTPAEPARRGPLVVVQSVDAPALVARLAARGIVASCRGNGLRVSFHAYNDESDVDAVVGALDAESALVERPAVRAV